MLLVAIYYIVLLIAVVTALWRGGPTERAAVYIALVASVLTTALTPFPAWTDIELTIFAIDILVLLGFWRIAAKSDKFWPYWITGWQLISILGHVQKMMFPEILAKPYWILSAYISYPILLLIIYVSSSNVQRGEAQS